MRRALVGADPVMQLIAGDDDLGAYLASAGRWDILGDGETGQLSPAVADSAKAAILARNAKLLRDVPPTQSRVFPLGFVSSGLIAPGDTAIIIARPQVIFRGERLSVPSDVAGDFTIDDVKVGKDSQFCAEGPIPARCLQENAWGIQFQLDTAQISQNIQLTVTNISGTSRTFRAMLMGSVVE